MTYSQRRGRGVVLGALLVLFALPATAFADPPTVTTGGVRDKGQTQTTLVGSIDPNKNRTFTFFQYGRTRAYDLRTPEIDRGAGNRKVTVNDTITGLTPFTTYHYRLVAQYGNKVLFGKDRTFKTVRQPLGISLAASPIVVEAGGDTVVSGNISGTGNAGRDVFLQANPFPFAGFFDQGNAQVADSAGNFAFPVLDVPVTTRYKVRLPSKPELASPEVTVAVKIHVTAHVKQRGKRKRKVTFSGQVTPSNAGAPVYIQRRYRGQWITRKRDSLGSESRYSTPVRISRDGRFRVLVTPGAAYVADESEIKDVNVK